VDDVTPGVVTHWIAKRLPLADDDHRHELAESMAGVVAERPRCERAWEAASLVGLWLRLWGRREGGDEARSAVRQGVYLGGVLLAFAVSAELWSHARHVDHAGGTGTVVVVAATLASAATALAAGGYRAGAVVASVGSMVAGTVATGTPRAVGIVAALALLAGDRFGARRCWRGLAVGILAAGQLAAVAMYAPAGLVPAGEAGALVAVPLAFLLVGWFDPRFAVAATMAWLGALVAVDPSAWPRALDDGTPSPDVVRWWVMGAAVVVAAHVSRTALRRAFAV